MLPKQGTAPRLEHDGKESHSPTRKPSLVIFGLLFAAASVTYSFVWMYYVRWKPTADIGLEIKQFSGATHSIEITNIHPEGSAERAGIRIHDEIVAIDGKNVASISPDVVQAAWLHRKPGDTVTLTIRRPGQQELLYITAVFRDVEEGGFIQDIAEEVVGTYPVVFLIVGLVVLFLRLQDRNAWLLALLCAGFIAAPPVPSYTAAMSSSLRTFIFAYRAIFLGMLPFTFYMFFAAFPQRSPLDQHLPWLKWLIGFAGVAIALPGIQTGHPQLSTVVSEITGDKAAHYGTLVYTEGTILLTLGSLCWNAVTSSQETRRKFRVILWGTLLGIFPAIVIRLFTHFGGFRIPLWLKCIEVMFLTLFPISFAYAVVKHRVMEIPILLRQSARYLLVKRGFALLLLLIALLVNLMLGLILSRIFKMEPALAMSIGGALGIALAWVSVPKVRRAAEMIDRAFFRGAYDARIILQELAQSVPAVARREQLPPLIEKEFHQALHPSSLAMYLRDSQAYLQPPLRSPCLAPVPVGSLSGNHILSRKQPIDASEYGGFSKFIPELRPLQPECLVPVLSRSGEVLGLIVLGAKLSQEPYSGEDKQLLGSVASQAGLVLESIELAEKMAERIDADRRVQQELQIAKKVQSKLLPQQAPALDTLDYAGACIQARAVGGDYYDFLGLDARHVGFVLADVAGKGISGALLMANLQASLRSYSAADKDLPQFLSSVNHLFVRNTETTHYATVFFGVYDNVTRKLRYANCGHNPPLLLRSNTRVERLEPTAIVLGLFEPWDCSVAEVQLFPGDILTIYTDGVTEASNCEEQEFGEERLIKVLTRGDGMGASELLQEVLNTVHAFSPGEQGDDLTLIVARCR